ncbi:MAG: hypothetical protein KIH89_004400 [Candidatus Shapirobacteria bacterium]|nr:hypothetical protein [Candidatus Shapirobacteria bacterium]
MLINSFSWWISLLMFWSFWFIFKQKKKYFWIFLLGLVILNLIINDLLFLRLDKPFILFDWEQSIWNYPGVTKSIERYRYEGLFLPFHLRNLFYSAYLKFSLWLINFSKLLSPYFWIKAIGFSGGWLMFLGLADFFKDKNRDLGILVWFLLILATSSWRMIGSSEKFIFLTLPVVFYWIYRGFKVNKYKLLLAGLLIFDLLL